ncbi:MAG: beta-N-acetylhexosaminidase [Thermotaleaceae bacterium]
MKHKWSIMMGVGALIMGAFLYTYNFKPETPIEKIDSLEPPKKQTENLQVPVDPVIEQLAALSLEEKLGQLMIWGFEESVSSERIQGLIQEYKVGGFILFQRNYQDAASMLQLTTQLYQWNRDNPLPLFISIDEEGGSVSRVPREATKFPDARLLGLSNDDNLTQRTAMAIGTELKALGVNVNFAPVLDVVSSKKNQLLYKRAFSGNPSDVARHGISFMKGLEKQGILSVPKHFPGHGDTQVDSHGSLPRIMIDRETLEERELVPFRTAIGNGADAIMIGHLAFPNIDPQALPATRSRLFLQDILRQELGFEGLIITDDMEMAGYVGKDISFEEAVLQSFEAGVDIFLICHTEDLQKGAYTALKKAIEDGRISEERLNASVLRIIKIKEKYGLQQEPWLNLEDMKNKIGTPEHKELRQEILNKSKSNPSSSS